jgi:DNA polymerase I
MPAPLPQSQPKAIARHKLYLVDGSGFIFRAYHALPPLTRKRDGMPVGAVVGFCNLLIKLMETAQSDGAVSHMAVIFDAGRDTFRNAIYPDYKANREAPPEDLVPQFAFMRDAVRAFNIPAVEKTGFEADDVIATYARLAREADYDVLIVSSDKDLMQLVGSGVLMLDPMKDRPIGEAEVREKFGVGPDRVVDVQALAGDSSDNVPGVPGIGVKTAADLIATYGDLDTLLARAGEIKQPKRREALLNHADDARMSRELVRLRDDVKLDEGLDDFKLKPIDPPRLFKFLDDMEFRGLKARMQDRLAAAGGLADRDAEAAEEAAAAAAVADAPAPAPAATAYGDYELVQDVARLEGWIAEAQAQGFVAVDTETTSLNAVAAQLVGVSMALVPGKACYIPLGHVAAEGLDLANAGTPRQIPLPEAVALLKPLLEDESVLKIGHNIKYDMVVLANYGITVGPVEDTMLLSYVLDGAKHRHNMDVLSDLHLGHKTITYDEVTKTGKKQIGFAEVALPRARDYAAEDADVTLRLYHKLKPRLLAERMVGFYETVERPLPPVIAAMERAGVRVDPATLKGLSADFARRMAELEEQAQRSAGEKFNLASPKQLGEILFDKLSLPGGKKGKAGAWGTDADVLENLASLGHELPKLVLDWRQLQKLKGTYTDALPQQIDPRTGRVHTSFALAATSTGRIASSDPNLQNIPIRTEEGRKIRRAFIADPGHKLMSADYSQIELRLLAHLADIGALKQAFREGTDIHALTASQVFGVPAEGMDPGVRRAAKAINFGIIYGISPFGLAAQLGIPQKEAARYIDAYFERYPGIRAYMEATKKLAREQGYVSTLFGRRCHVAGINSRNPAERGFNERAAINAPLQGTAADVVKRAMIRLPAALAEKRLRARLLLQVHDELLFEVAEGEVPATRALVKKVMEGAAQFSVPLPVEIGVGDNWEEAH